MNNYEKALKNSQLGQKNAKNAFKKKYPYADIDKFDFYVNLTKTGELESTDVVYKVDDVTGYDITSETFKTEYSEALHSGPSIWMTDGTDQHVCTE